MSDFVQDIESLYQSLFWRKATLILRWTEKTEKIKQELTEMWANATDEDISRWAYYKSNNNHDCGFFIEKGKELRQKCQKKLKK